MSDVRCSSRHLNLSCHADSAPRSPSYGSPEVYLSLLAAPVALIILFRRSLHLAPPPFESEQPPDGLGGPKIPIAEDAGKVGVPVAGVPAISSSVHLPAEPCRWEAAPRFRYPPIRYLEAAGPGGAGHLFDPDSNPRTIYYNRVRAPPHAPSTHGTVGGSDEIAGILNKMESALRGICLDIHSSDESTIHPANDVLIYALPYVYTNTEMVQSIFVTSDYTIESYSHMFDFWISKLEDDAERIFGADTGRRNIFLLNNIYDVWQIMRRPGASFSNVELVSRLITMIQHYRRSYLDVCWVPVSNQRRLNKFTTEFLIISSQQMTWKVTAELKYNLRQEIVGCIVPSYEASLVAMQAKRSPLLGVFFSVKRAMLGKKKQTKYAGEELENVIRELFEG